MTQKISRLRTRRDIISTFCFRAIAVLTLIMTAIAIVGAVFSINKKALFFADNNWLFGLFTPLLVLLGTAGLIFFWYKMFKVTEKLSVKKLNIISGGLLALFTVICTVMCVFMKVTPNTDSKFIQDMALTMAETGIYEIDTTRAYFQNYSNNDLLTILIGVFFKAMLALGVKDLSQACIWLNGVCVVLGEILTYFGVRIMWGPKNACRYLLISVMQPAIYLTVPWAYSNTMCLPFMCGLFLICAVIYTAESMVVKGIFAALYGLVAVIGYFIRPVVMFEAIAFAIFAVFYFIVNRYSFSQIAACILAAAIFGGTVFFGVNSFITERGGDNSRNYPVTHWIMMGLHRDGTFSGKDSKFTRDLITKKQKTDAHIAEIKKEINERGPIGLATLGAGKICITWSDGSANYYLRDKLTEETNLVTRITVGGGRGYIMLYGQMFRAATLLLAAAAMVWIIKKRHLTRTFFPLVTLFGGMLFYLIWEAKESYSIPFLFIIIIIAITGMERITRYMNNKKRSF